MLHAVHEEMAESVSDVLIRRTTLAFETRDYGRTVAPHVASLMAKHLKWTDAGERQSVAEFARETDRIFSITP